VVVRKYGGSSLADIPRLREVARDLRRARKEGLQLVVVVSAMGDQTDRLADLAREANPEPPRRELDMLLTVGERTTMSLLCMALAAEGVPAVSFTGSQAGILTDASHNDAQIVAVRPIRLPEALAAGKVVVVAGFQGVSEQTKEITTLGRGGSDTSAVALAHALGAVRCEILKDVPGVMTADPKRVPAARGLERLSYDELLRIADAGCGVVHRRAVEYARTHDVPLFVGSSFAPGPGTTVTAAAPPPLPPAAEFAPLALTVAEAQGRLVLGSLAPAPHPGLPTLARRAAAATPLTAEWLARGDRWYWEGWGSAAALGPVATDALALAKSEPETVMAHWEDAVGVITLAGRRPESWCGALEQLSELLAASELPDVPVRTDGEGVRILVPAGRLTPLARTLHHRLLAG
jgi:aspartate kinase